MKMKWYDRLSLTARTMIRVLGVLYLVLLAAGLLVILLLFPFEGPLPYAVGLTLGVLLSVLKVAHMEHSLSKTVDMDSSGSAKSYASLMAVLRYLLTIAVLLCAVFLRQAVGVFGVVIGILCLQLCAYIAAFRLRGVNLDAPARPREEG